MKKLNALFLTTILLISSGAYAAGTMADAYKALNNGNFELAIEIIKPLALKGNSYAQSNLGVMYSKGQGVTQDYTEAARWLKLAATQGDEFAQSNLGVMYSKGQGVTQDYTEALKWDRLAATQGYALAQFNLGVMYYKGQGVAQENVLAHMWWNVSGAQGNISALTNRDILEKKMTVQELAEAQKLARECLARNYKGC